MRRRRCCEIPLVTSLSGRGFLGRTIAAANMANMSSPKNDSADSHHHPAPNGVRNSMGRFSRVKTRLRGKSKRDGGSKGSSGVSSPSATPPPAQADRQGRSQRSAVRGAGMVRCFVASPPPHKRYHPKRGHAEGLQFDRRCPGPLANLRTDLSPIRTSADYQRLVEPLVKLY
ncbi:hypothetical protein GE09DRAFT_261133 [Coniochaeta sp. 2T2.1]|nr:hypothetical protein GE09DRAFT_261133 [Coniochaeta sp. 2T2.1]